MLTSRSKKQRTFVFDFCKLFTDTLALPFYISEPARIV
jgi:hypothetical protein